MTLSSEDLKQLDVWRRACESDPGRLPRGVEPVRTRLIRNVGRGILPDAGPVFVKLMGFPRRRDRLRYLLRPMPAAHEAALLRRLHRAGVACPEVLAVWTRRWCGRPRYSCLVTRELPLADRPASLDEALTVIARLMELRIYHPDLHGGNVCVLRDGQVAVMDLQSARASFGAVSTGRRVRMVAKCLGHFANRDDGVVALLVEQGVLSHHEAARAWAMSAELLRRERIGRVRRCVRESSAFVVSRRLRGTLFRRRSVESPEGEPITGGRELLRCWIGDRVREIEDRAAPACDALFLGVPWWPGRSRLFLASSLDRAAFQDVRPILEQGYERYQEMLKAGPSPHSV